MAGLASMHAADLRTAEGIQKGAASSEEAHTDTAPVGLKLVVRLMRAGCLIAEVRHSFNAEACMWLSLLGGWYGLIRHLCLQSQLHHQMMLTICAHAASNAVCV